MRVMGSRVLIKRVAPPKKKSTIEVVAFEDEESVFGEVVYTGVITLKDGRKQELEVKAGDKVITKQYCGTPVKINNQDLFFVNLDDILAVIK